AVVPFTEIAVDNRIGKAGEGRSGTGALHRTRQHEREPLARKNGCQPPGGGFTLGQERQVGDAGVPPPLAPFGLPVPDDPDLGPAHPRKLAMAAVMAASAAAAPSHPRVDVSLPGSIVL